MRDDISADSVAVDIVTHCIIPQFVGLAPLPALLLVTVS
jgi:hypothetical protein